MAIRYKIIPRKQPGKQGEVKYYGVQRSSQIDADQFIENIVQKNTCTRADVLAVLASIKEELVASIRNGQSVTLGELGTFRFTIKTQGVEQKKDFSADNIKKVCVRFLPSRTLMYDTSRQNPAVTFLYDEPAGKTGA
ncbi:MAG: HU family DNA-binding protein [Bacteroidaceae bacterium]|nr:HU family DNA-binding protein [Bacteroidaceae bacterium]